MPDTGVSEKLEVTSTRECYFSYLLLRTAFLFMTQKLILVIACAKLGQTVVPCGLGLFRPGTKLWTNNHTVSEKIGEKGIFFLKLSGNPEHIYLFHFVHAQQIAYVILNTAGIC